MYAGVSPAPWLSTEGAGTSVVGIDELAISAATVEVADGTGAAVTVGAGKDGGTVVGTVVVGSVVVGSGCVGRGWVGDTIGMGTTVVVVDV